MGRTDKAIFVAGLVLGVIVGAIASAVIIVFVL